jgi:cell fate regulator YaaT (PSP1 superfamily)
MVESITVLDKELLDISKMVDILQVDLYDKEAKKKLLWACRNAMQQTVALLQISDRYDIRKIIRGAKLCHVENDRMATLTDVSQLTEGVRYPLWSRNSTLCSGLCRLFMRCIIACELSW